MQCMRRAVIGRSQVCSLIHQWGPIRGTACAAVHKTHSGVACWYPCTISSSYRQLMSHKHAGSPTQETSPRTHKTLKTHAAASAGHASMKRVLVPVANGSEEMEAVIMIDVLRRAGAEVVVASVEHSLQVECSRGVKLVADKLITDAVQHDYDLIALPGGMPGAERLRDCAPLEELLKQHKAAEKHYAAICATPAVFFQAKGLIDPHQKATAHPGFEKDLKDQSAIKDRVVVDGKLVTSRGPGTAMEFALELVKILYGEHKAASVAKPLVMYPNTVVAHH